MIICITGFNSKEEQEIKQQIESLGGTYVRDLNKKISCLIIKRVGTSKYNVAIRYKLPIVLIDWLVECLSQSKFVSIENYRPKLFSGLTMTCTNVDVESRKAVIKSIENNGGVYSKPFIPNFVTHVICGSPIQELTEKYIQAKSFSKVLIVSPNWIFKCIDVNEYVEECKFLTEEVAADPSSNQTINFKNDDITEDAADKPTIMSLKDIVQGQPLMQSYFYDEVFEPFLNEVFFVHGFSNDITDYLTSIILAGGGFRNYCFDNNVTLIILGEHCEESIAVEVKNNPFAVCVNPVWIIEKYLKRT